MIYAVAALISLAQQCAPEVATEALIPLVLTESGGDPLRINVNKGPHVRAGSIAEGVVLVRRYMASGYSVDVGLAQVNSANFARLGVTVEEAFDPCTNLHLASTVLQEGYGLASRTYTGLDAISATYSLYNTGSLTRGFRNGYVGRVWSAASALGSIPVTPPFPGSPTSADGAAATAAAPLDDRDRWVVSQMTPGTFDVFK